MKPRTWSVAFVLPDTEYSFRPLVSARPWGEWGEDANRHEGNEQSGGRNHRGSCRIRSTASGRWSRKVPEGGGSAARENQRSRTGRQRYLCRMGTEGWSEMGSSASFRRRNGARYAHAPRHSRRRTQCRAPGWRPCSPYGGDVESGVAPLVPIFDIRLERDENGAFPRDCPPRE